MLALCFSSYQRLDKDHTELLLYINLVFCFFEIEDRLYLHVFYSQILKLEFAYTYSLLRSSHKEFTYIELAQIIKVKKLKV